MRGNPWTSSITKLPNLQKGSNLGITGNKITKRANDCKSLDIFGNKITERTKESKSLDISGNKIIGRADKGESLDITGNKITETAEEVSPWISLPNGQTRIITC